MTCDGCETGRQLCRPCRVPWSAHVNKDCREAVVMRCFLIAGTPRTKQPEITTCHKNFPSKQAKQNAEYCLGTTPAPLECSIFFVSSHGEFWTWSSKPLSKVWCQVFFLTVYQFSACPQKVKSSLCGSLCRRADKMQTAHRNASHHQAGVT